MPGACSYAWSSPFRFRGGMSAGQRTSIRMRGQEVLAYPAGFHTAAGLSGWVAPVSSQARAVISTRPTGSSRVACHSCHAHGPAGASRSA